MPSKKQRRHRKQNANANTCPTSPPANAEPKTDENLYKVENSDVLGRYMVASRDLAAGETLICEQPLVVGPCSTADPVCLGCYKPITFDALLYRCDQCEWPMCGRKCATEGHLATGHSKIECDFLTQHCIGSELKSSTVVERARNLFELILIVRILLMREHMPDAYAKVMCMESHYVLRKQNKKLWEYYQTNIVNRLRDEWKLADKYTEQEIHTVCGILDVNCFEIGQNPAKARALYPTAYLLAHDCCPNTAHTDDPQTYALKLRTSRRIARGETLTLSYAYTLQGTLKRREFIYAGKLFWCLCARCADPKELGTDCSAIKCSNCTKGFIRSSEPLNSKADWHCDYCQCKRSAKSIDDFLTQSNDDLESIDVHNVLGLENFLQRYQDKLHKNHYLILSAKYTLCQTYGRIDDFLLPNMSVDDIKRKERYCREFLAIINIIEPGLTRLRGLIMYELHAPIMMIAQMNMQLGKIGMKEFQRNLKEVANLLRESSDILLLEPPGSSDYEMGKAAQIALHAMQGSC